MDEGKSKTNFRCARNLPYRAAVDLLARQTEWVFKDQGRPAAMVLASSANAVVPKKGSEANDRFMSW